MCAYVLGAFVGYRELPTRDVPVVALWAAMFVLATFPTIYLCAMFALRVIGAARRWWVRALFGASLAIVPLTAFGWAFGNSSLRVTSETILFAVMFAVSGATYCVFCVEKTRASMAHAPRVP